MEGRGEHKYQKLSKIISPLVVPLLSRVYSICPCTSHWTSEQWYSWERRSEDGADELMETLWSTSCVLALWDLLGMPSLLLPRSLQLVGGRLRNERRLMVQVGRCSCTGVASCAHNSQWGTASVPGDGSTCISLYTSRRDEF